MVNERLRVAELGDYRSLVLAYLRDLRAAAEASAGAAAAVVSSVLVLLFNAWGKEEVVCGGGGLTEVEGLSGLGLVGWGGVYGYYSEEEFI